MSPVVYSAAKALVPFNGKSREEVWKELTAMFNPNDKNPKSYIVNNYALDCVKRRKPDDISLGDLFKYETYLGNDYYIHIVECDTYKSFAFEDKSSPYSEEGNDHKSRMDFLLQSHSNGTLVEIRRRDKGDAPTWRELLFAKLGIGDDSGDNATHLLTSITNSPPGRNGSTPWIEGTIVERDDSNRRNF